MNDPTITTETTRTAPAPRPARRRGMKLATLPQIARALGAEVRSLQRLDVESMRVADRIAKARAIGTLLTATADVLRASDLERRLQALEDLTRATFGRH